MSVTEDRAARPDPRVTRTRNDVGAVALRLLIDEGWEAVTPGRVAAESGYARATIYTHWPSRVDLVGEAFARFGEMPHHSPAGDIAADLRGELESFVRAMVERRLDRALAMLAERSQVTPAMIPVRDAFVAEGERPMRATLADLPATDRDAVVAMLCGMVTHSVLMQGAPPTSAVLTAAVDIVLAGLDARAR